MPSAPWTLPTVPTRRLWVVPLAAGLLPIAAALGALALFVAFSAGPACNPLVDGCVSISRAARHGVANHFFRLLILPAAVGQGLTWALCGAWLAHAGGGRDRTLRLLPWIGGAATACLVLYVMLLGTHGEPYDWARVYGIPVYFFGTYVCMVITASRGVGLVRSGPTATLCSMLLLLPALVATGAGLVQIFVRPFLVEKIARNQLTNALEWNTGLMFSVFFFGLAWAWYRTQRRPAARAAGSELDPESRRARIVPLFSPPAGTPRGWPSPSRRAPIDQPRRTTSGG